MVTGMRQDTFYFSVHPHTHYKDKDGKVDANKLQMLQINNMHKKYI